MKPQEPSLFYDGFGKYLGQSRLAVNCPIASRQGPYAPRLG